MRVHTIRVAVAATRWLRLRGLLGRPQLAPGCGLLLPGERWVHGVGMRWPIDLVFVDREWRILRTDRLRPGAISGCRSARATLELRHGETARLGLAVGDRIQALPVDSIEALAGAAASTAAPAAALAAGGRAGGAPAWSRRAGRHRLRAGWLGVALLWAMSGALSDLRAAPPELPAGSLAAAQPVLPLAIVPGERLSGLLQAAEARYQRGDFEQALSDFRFIAEASPAIAVRAWLRVGNIEQRQGRPLAALAAYRQAADALPADAPAGQREDARKALVNSVLLALDHAGDALDRVAAEWPSAVSADNAIVDALGLRLQRLQQASGAPSAPLAVAVGRPVPAEAVAAERMAAERMVADVRRRSPPARVRNPAVATPRTATTAGAGEEDADIGLPRIDYLPGPGGRER